MKLEHRFVVKVTLRITEVKDGKLNDRQDGMDTDVTFALANTRIETITEALNTYVVEHWSKKPHEITRIYRIESAAKADDYIYAQG